MIEESHIKNQVLGTKTRWPVTTIYEAVICTNFPILLGTCSPQEEEQAETQITIMQAAGGGVCNWYWSPL